MNIEDTERKPLSESAKLEAMQLIDKNFDRAQELMHFMAKYWIDGVKDIHPDSSPAAVMLFTIMEKITDHPDKNVEAYDCDSKVYIGGDPIFAEGSVEDMYKDSKMMWILREARKTGIDGIHDLRRIVLAAREMLGETEES